MLTRDGERAFEVLLLSAGLALTMLLQDDLPGLGGSLGESPNQSDGPAYLHQARHIEWHPAHRISAPADPIASAGRIDQVLRNL